MDVVTSLEVISVLDLLRIMRNLFLKVLSLNQNFNKSLNNLNIFLFKYSILEMHSPIDIPNIQICGNLKSIEIPQDLDRSIILEAI